MGKGEKPVLSNLRGCGVWDLFSVINSFNSCPKTQIFPAFSPVTRMSRLREPEIGAQELFVAREAAWQCDHEWFIWLVAKDKLIFNSPSAKYFSVTSARLLASPMDFRLLSDWRLQITVFLDFTKRCNFQACKSRNQQDLVNASINWSQPCQVPQDH